ncbi:MAG: hypothetical protein JST54_08245 [Deltaproteobacteria bacterium]|nr:hypothetical protein [Deltaproteobacteria bacterium]
MRRLAMFAALALVGCPHAAPTPTATPESNEALVAACVEFDAAFEGIQGKPPHSARPATDACSVCEALDPCVRENGLASAMLDAPRLTLSARAMKGITVAPPTAPLGPTLAETWAQSCGYCHPEPATNVDVPCSELVDAPPLNLSGAPDLDGCQKLEACAAELAKRSPDRPAGQLVASARASCEARWSCGK